MSSNIQNRRVPFLTKSCDNECSNKSHVCRSFSGVTTLHAHYEHGKVYIDKEGKQIYTYQNSLFSMQSVVCVASEWFSVSLELSVGRSDCMGFVLCGSQAVRMG